MLGLLVALFHALVAGMAGLFLLARVSPWIWAIPLLGIYVVGTVLIFVHGDKIVVAEKS